MQFKIGDRVRLISFLGEDSSPPGVWPHENYWKLIGESGSVVNNVAPSSISKLDKQHRVLIQLNVDLSAIGLEAHNEIPNSLWIRTSDIEMI